MVTLGPAQAGPFFSIRALPSFHLERHRRACPGDPDHLAQPCHAKRGGRDEPGHDQFGVTREKRCPFQGIEFTARDAQIWCIEMGLQ
jgi:hypothetical protein